VFNGEFKALHHEGINAIEDRRIEHLMGKTFPGAKEALGQLNDTLNTRVKDTQAKINAHMQDMYKKANDMRTNASLQPYSDIGQFTKDFLQRDILERSQVPEEKTAGSILGQLTYESRFGFKAVDMPSILTQVMIEASLQYEGQKPTENMWNPELLKTATAIADKMRTAKVREMPSTQDVADFWQKEIVPMVQSLFTRAEEQQQQQSGVSASDDNGVKEDGKPSYAKASMTQKMKDMVDMMRGVDKESGNNDSGFNYELKCTELRDVIRLYGYKLKRILRDNMYDRVGGRHLSGTLNTRKLYKHRIGNMRLFQRKTESDKKDFSFSIACDASGSMGVQGFKVARDAMVLLNEVLSYCNIPTSVYAFNWRIKQAKGLMEQTNPRQFSKVFERHGGGTDMIGVYKASVPELTNLGRKNKIHICITDGEIHRDEREEIQELMRKHNGIKYYGIGIKVDLEDLFPSGQRFTVQSVDDVPTTLMGIVQKHIIG
jgi:hypothetical protein